MWIFLITAMVQYHLNKLPYDYDSLEPYIDAKTMEIHFQSHHQSYVEGLNNVLDELGGSSHPKYISAILSDLVSVPENYRNKINFFGGGFENHRIFWEIMNPNGGGSPGGKLEDSIEVYFENFENFKKIFSNVALSIEGSGWCWLVFNQTFNKIEIITTQNQDSPWVFKKIPLLGLDVWEHAYYLKYQYNRGNYISSWWNVVNWDYVENRFLELVG